MTKIDDIHNGKHFNCRACGTNPRALGTNPRAVHKSTLPHPLKCADCDYIAKNTADSKLHRFDEH